VGSADVIDGAGTMGCRGRAQGPEAGQGAACSWGLDPAGADGQASGDGQSTIVIAAQLECPPQTVRERLHRFNTSGLDGLGDRPGAGRHPRLTGQERSRIIALAATTPPGRLTRQADGALQATHEAGGAHWTVDSLTEALNAEGIVIGRSQAAESCWLKGFAGARHAHGPPVRIRSSSQKDTPRRSLHAATGGCHGCPR
jgi:transposase